MPLAASLSPLLPNADQVPLFCGHKVVLDEQHKIIPWSVPRQNAYDRFLRARWDFIKTRVSNCPGPPPRSSYPEYYFFCAF